MKTIRNMKIKCGLLMAAAALLCLAGCKKENEGGNGEKVVLGLEFEKAVSGQKTYIDAGGFIGWHDGDSIKVNGETCYIHGDKVEVEAADQYIATYPVQSYFESPIMTQNMIPSEQEYVLDGNGRQVVNGPMIARLDSRSGRLYFKNVYSLLKVTVSADDQPFTVRSIQVDAAVMTGLAIYRLTGPTTADDASNLAYQGYSLGTHKVTLDCGAGVTVAAGADSVFYLVVLPRIAQTGNSGDPLKITVHGVLNGSRPAVYTHTTETGIGLSRSRIGNLGINLQQLFPDHDYVDLGLPSETLWATCNVGAVDDDPESYGDYFAWGETETFYSSLNPLVWKTGKEQGYDALSMKYYISGSNPPAYSKYNSTDGKTVLDPEDDAATANWGENWRTPTKAEWQELINQTDHVQVTLKNGKYGLKCSSKKNPSKYIILPCAGQIAQTDIQSEGNFGNYQTSHIDGDGIENNEWRCWVTTIQFGMMVTTIHNINLTPKVGLSVRPVRTR